jgi:crotonobetainyl-CoA:carnitine CoA-transferase CaiB-like acyl-CoA transferase
LPDLAVDARFLRNSDRVKHRETLIPILERKFADQSASHWIECLDTYRVAVSAINPVDRVLNHPQAIANDMIMTIGTARLLGTPFKLAQGGGVSPLPPRPIGADTDSILRDELGMDAAVIAALRAEAVIP